MLFQTSSPSAATAGDAASPETSNDVMKHSVVVSCQEEDGRDRRPTVAAAEDYSRRKSGRKRKEFPPAIPWLYPPEKMPLVLKRYHTSDGRLILRAETARHHKYLRAHRSNGRLRLELVALNDVVRDGEGEDDDGEIAQCGEERGNTCFPIESQTSIKRLRSRLLRVQVPLTPETNFPVHI